MVGCVGEWEEQKRERFTGQDKDTLVHEGKKGGKKQVMQRQVLNTSHQQTGAQPVSEQQRLWKD